MRMEGLEEPGGDPTGWHENRRGCQLARVSGRRWPLDRLISDKICLHVYKKQSTLLV